MVQKTKRKRELPQFAFCGDFDFEGTPSRRTRKARYDLFECAIHSFRHAYMREAVTRLWRGLFSLTFRVRGFDPFVGVPLCVCAGGRGVEFCGEVTETAKSGEHYSF